MRMRLEELAAQADVSVDTVRGYLVQRLLPAPTAGGGDGREWYSEEHLERLARIADLQRHGFSDAMTARILTGDMDQADERLALAVVDASDETENQSELFDLESLAAHVQLPADLVASLAADGMLMARHTPGGDRFTSADAETLAAGLKLVEAGLPLDELLALARHHHAVTREVATRAVDLFDTFVRKPLRSSSRSEAEKAEHLVGAFSTLMPAITTIVAHHFRRILLAVAQEHLEAVGETDEIAAAASEASWR